MKNTGKFFTLAALSFAVACSNAPTETVETTEAETVNESPEMAATYTLITEGDEVKWEGFKTYSGDSHQGTLQVTEGEFQVENGNLVGGSFIIDMNSINNLDLEGNAEYKAKLEGHLKSEDFFHTAEYPTATFTITSVTPAGADAENGATHNISGNLKMRGSEKNITFPAKVSIEENMVSLTTPEFVIDRTNWNVMYGSKSIETVTKDNLIDNNIRLEVDVKAGKA